MQDVIKVKNASYERYEELLLKKEALKKEAEEYQIQYNEVFNMLNNDTYEARLECIKKRKIVSYCEERKKNGRLVYQNELDDYIDNAMKEYKDALNFILKNDDDDKKQKNSPEYNKQVKTIYHKLARLIHPDMNNDLKDDKTIQDLWNRTCIANNCLDLEEMEELDILINKYLASLNNVEYEIEIPNVDEKIFNLNREIEKILHTDPYQYKYVLADKAVIERKKEELLKELTDYKRYLSELNKQIDTFLIIK